MEDLKGPLPAGSELRAGRSKTVRDRDRRAKVRATVEWAKTEGLEDKISPQTAELAKAAALSDADVERLVAEHSQARKTRDFSRSDAIRAQLAENGIILENTKDGVRWRRK